MSDKPKPVVVWIVECKARGVRDDDWTPIHVSLSKVGAKHYLDTSPERDGNTFRWRTRLAVAS